MLPAMCDFHEPFGCIIPPLQGEARWGWGAILAEHAVPVKGRRV